MKKFLSKFFGWIYISQKKFPDQIFLSEIYANIFFDREKRFPSTYFATYLSH